MTIRQVFTAIVDMPYVGTVLVWFIVGFIAMGIVGVVTDKIARRRMFKGGR